MQTLANIGITRVYVSVWKNGYAYFNSSTILNLAGKEALGADHLLWAVKYGHQYSLEVYAWFEDGFSSGVENATNPFQAKTIQLNWVLGKSNGLIWLDSRKVDVTNFFSDLIVDVASKYGVDGSLLGRFCLPSSLAGPSVAKMTAIATTIEERYFSTYSKPLSVGLDALQASLIACNVDYASWSDDHLFSEYVPRLFVNSYNNYVPLLQSLMLGTSKPSHDSMIIGLLCNDQQPTPWAELHQMILLTNRKNFGIAIWSAEGVLETYPQAFTKLWREPVSKL